MRQVTVIFPYYMNPEMLRQQFNLFRDLPHPLRLCLRLIIVDDGSPRDPATMPESPVGVPVKIFRILKDVRWNQDAAKNIAAHESVTPWLLLTDIDHLMPQATLERVTFGSLDMNSVYRFSRVSAPQMLPYRPHPNSWMMTRRMYMRIGGYDERFAGYYGTDGDFTDRVIEYARTVEILPEFLIRVPTECVPDAATTTYGRKEKQDDDNIPRIRRERKSDRNWRPLNLTFPYERVH